MRANIEGSRISEALLAKKNKMQTGFQVLGATLTMDAGMSPIMSIDPGGAARDVLLPPEEDGLWFILANTADGIETLTVKEDSGTTTIVTLAQDKTALVFCAYNEAGALEWRAILTA